ncbi:uncharacterized protein LOC144580198 [Callithrix jacchus]
MLSPVSRGFESAGAFCRRRLRLALDGRLLCTERPDCKLIVCVAGSTAVLASSSGGGQVHLDFHLESVPFCLEDSFDVPCVVGRLVVNVKPLLLIQLGATGRTHSPDSPQPFHSQSAEWRWSCRTPAGWEILELEGQPNGLRPPCPSPASETPQLGGPRGAERPAGSRDGSSRSLRRLHPVREPVPILPRRFRAAAELSRPTRILCLAPGLRQAGMGSFEEPGKKKSNSFPWGSFVLFFCLVFETGSHLVTQAGVQWCKHGPLQP